MSIDHVRGKVVGDRRTDFCPAAAGSSPAAQDNTPPANFVGRPNPEERIPSGLDAETSAERLAPWSRAMSGTCAGHADAMERPPSSTLLRGYRQMWYRVPQVRMFGIPPMF